MKPIAYIKIQYSDHTYTATVHNTQQLEDYFSCNLAPFKIVDTKILDAQAAQSISQMLNRISRFGHSLNKSATWIIH
mgnify:CR=1 FL=1|jgi:hypothetical protein